MLSSYLPQSLHHPSLFPLSNVLPSPDAPPINTKSSKMTQFREEMRIRNADSGKIMGVKGRRVAIVEELSKTVISFQKVETASIGRILTITGIDEESVRNAKMLIEDTIFRNVSPDREKGIERKAACEIKGTDNNQDGDDNAKISIDTSDDGTIKLCCNNPQILQAAQSAITDYINRTQVARRSVNFTYEEKELRKDRRKSMPMQGTASDKRKETGGSELDSKKNENWRSALGCSAHIAKASPVIAVDGDLPNSVEPLAARKSEAFIYGRSDLISWRSKCTLNECEIAQLKETMPEILSSVTE